MCVRLVALMTLTDRCGAVLRAIRSFPTGHSRRRCLAEAAPSPAHIRVQRLGGRHCRGCPRSRCALLNRHTPRRAWAVPVGWTGRAHHRVPPVQRLAASRVWRRLPLLFQMVQFVCCLSARAFDRATTANAIGGATPPEGARSSSRAWAYVQPRVEEGAAEVLHHLRHLLRTEGHRLRAIDILRIIELVRT